MPNLKQRLRGLENSLSFIKASHHKEYTPKNTALYLNEKLIIPLIEYYFDGKSAQRESALKAIMLLFYYCHRVIKYPVSNDGFLLDYVLDEGRRLHLINHYAMYEEYFCDKDGYLEVSHLADELKLLIVAGVKGNVLAANTARAIPVLYCFAGMYDPYLREVRELVLSKSPSLATYLGWWVHDPEGGLRTLINELPEWKGPISYISLPRD